MKSKPLRIGIFTQLEHSIQREVVRSFIGFASKTYGWDFHLPRPLGAPWLSSIDNPLDGVVAWPAVEDLPFLRRLKVPVVCLGSNILGEFPNVAFDNEEAGRMAARHFLSHGLRRFAVLSGEPSLFCKLRAQGFERVIRELPAECRIFQIQKYPYSQTQWAKFASDFHRWQRQTSQPVGVLADTDLTGFLALPVLRQAGLKIPEDVALLTVGSDSLLCSTSSPALSSVVIPGTIMGQEAAQLLHAILTKRRIPSAPIMIPPSRIVERGSSHLLHVDDELVARALKAINAHAGTPFAVADLVKIIPASRRSLEVRFKRALGRTMQKEIWRVHLEKAKQLLVETHLPLPDVADRSGFSDAQRLCEVFRRELKESPSAYRKRCQEIRFS